MTMINILLHLGRERLLFLMPVFTAESTSTELLHAAYCSEKKICPYTFICYHHILSLQ